MLNLFELDTKNKEKIDEAANTLNETELNMLVDNLASIDDKVRYPSYLLLMAHSKKYNNVYAFWNQFKEKLNSDNSYQRNIGLQLISVNTQWDTKKLLPSVIDDYLKCIHDEKPITVRQCIQGLLNIVPHYLTLHSKITQTLIKNDLMLVSENMRKSILLDTINALLLIQSYKADAQITKYILNALSGGILDEKSKKQIAKLI